jgi:hypothetical protein
MTYKVEYGGTEQKSGSNIQGYCSGRAVTAIAAELLDAVPSCSSMRIKTMAVRVRAYLLHSHTFSPSRQHRAGRGYHADEQTPDDGSIQLGAAF